VNKSHAIVCKLWVEGKHLLYCNFFVLCENARQQGKAGWRQVPGGQNKATIGWRMFTFSADCGVSVACPPNGELPICSQECSLSKKPRGPQHKITNKKLRPSKNHQPKSATVTKKVPSHDLLISRLACCRDANLEECALKTEYSKNIPSRKVVTLYGLFLPRFILVRFERAGSLCVATSFACGIHHPYRPSLFNWIA
jgi:hypothetical protein